MKVFISHSRDDKAGLKFFKTLFSASPHEPLWHPCEEMPRPPGPALLKGISGAGSLFIVLSKNMDDARVMACLSYKVGLAAAMKKSIWVFEPQGETISVPVPDLSVYVRFPKKFPKKATPPFDIIAKNGGHFGNPDFFGPRGSVLHRCSNDECRSSYYMYSDASGMVCPVCKKEQG